MHFRKHDPDPYIEAHHKRYLVDYRELFFQAVRERKEKFPNVSVVKDIRNADERAAHQFQDNRFHELIEAYETQWKAELKSLLTQKL